MQARKLLSASRLLPGKRRLPAYLLLCLFTACSLAGEVQASQERLNGAPAAPLHPRGRILVITIDSLPKDVMFGAQMPFISSCRKRGAWGTSKVASTPFSISGTKAIFAGTLAGPLDIFRDFSSPRAPRDSFLTRAARQGKRVALFNYLLEGICPDVASFRPQSLSFGQYRKEADDVFSQAYRFLRHDTWDIAAVSTYGLDHAGHLETPQSPRFAALASAIDAHVRRLVSLTGDQDTVLITSEHGMNRYGLHMDQSPAVVETGFVLWGPGVKKGGPKTVLQIDWAPTLSVLAGVSPVYDSPAMPAMDVIALPEAARNSLLARLSVNIAGSSTALRYRELKNKRAQELGTGIPFAVGATAASAALAAMIGLLQAAIADARAMKAGHRWLLGALLAAAVFLASRLAPVAQAFSFASASFSFSMNFISSHPASVFLAGLAVLVVSLALSRHGDRKLILLSLYALIVPHIFLSLDALSLLGWTVFVVLPVAGWSVSRDRAWIAVFLSLWAGLFIRRLTFYNAFAHLYLPPRWVLCALLVAAGAVFLRLQLRKAEHAAGTSAWGAASFIPAVLAIMLVPQVKVRALLLLACLIPVLRAARQAPEAKRTLAALWVAVFYLGTSSNINHLTQLVAFPLFIALWAIAGRSPAFIKGVLIGFAVWALYLLPGNALNLNISELGDTFILNSANKQSIIYTILVIAGRYLLPVTALVAGMIWSLPRAKLLPVAAGALVPFLAALGILWTKVTFFPAGGYPWQEIVRIAVVSVYLIVVIGAFVLAGALRRAHAALARRMPAWSPQ